MGTGTSAADPRFPVTAGARLATGSRARVDGRLMLRGEREALLATPGGRTGAPAVTAPRPGHRGCRRTGCGARIWRRWRRRCGRAPCTSYALPPVRPVSSWLPGFSQIVLLHQRRAWTGVRTSLSGVVGCPGLLASGCSASHRCFRLLRSGTGGNSSGNNVIKPVAAGALSPVSVAILPVIIDDTAGQRSSAAIPPAARNGP